MTAGKAGTRSVVAGTWVIREPVHWEYRMPGTGSTSPPVDVVPACLLSFNSLNKFAQSKRPIRR
jgi:hypothetical protein